MKKRKEKKTVFAEAHGCKNFAAAGITNKAPN